MPPFAGPLMLNFTADEPLQGLSQTHGRHQQLPIVNLGGITRQIVKQVCTVSADRFIAGEHAYVSVELSRNAVVVASGKMNVAAYGIAFAPNHQGGLTVHL